jgi:hypothetical protein
MSSNLDTLRAQIRAIETHGRPASAYLPIGAIDLDGALGGGLNLGGVSEVSPATFLDEPASMFGAVRQDCTVAMTAVFVLIVSTWTAFATGPFEAKA